MSHVRLDPGIYTNVFPVTLPEEPVLVMITARKDFTDLRPLREKIRVSGWNTRVYATGGSVYGYGTDAHRLGDVGFHAASILLSANPGFAARLILEGLADAARSEGYEVRFSRARLSMFGPSPFGKTPGDEVFIYLGYDLRALYWGDKANPSFGLVVDVTWAFRDGAGNHLDMREVAERGATVQVAQIQGEYLQGGSRINTEVSRRRLLEEILPFVQSRCMFTLPCGGSALLETEPARVILGGSER